MDSALFISSLFHFTGIIDRLLRHPIHNEKHRWRNLAICYSGLLIVVSVYSLAAQSGILPTFFVQGAGPTPIRQAVMAMTFLLYLVSAISLMMRFAQERVPFLYWYSLALALLSLSMVSNSLIHAMGSPMSWTARTAQYMAGIYFIFAVVSAKRSASSHGIGLDEAISELFHRSERKISTIYAHITDCYYELDRDWRFTRINDKALEFLGKSRLDVIGRKYWDVLPEGKGSIFEEQYGKALKEGVSVHFEVPSAIHKDRWVEIHAYPIDEGLSVYFRDITERKQVEQALRKSQEWFSKLFSLTPEPLALASLDSSIIREANRAYCELLGLSREDIIGKSSVELGIWPDPEERLKARDILVKHGSLRDFEFHLKTKSGEIRNVLLSIDTIDLDDIPYMLFSLRDVTERKQAEIALRKSEDRFRRIFESNMLPIAFWNADGFLTATNLAFCDLLGFSPEEVQAGAIKWTDVTPPDMLWRDRQGIDEINEKGFCTPYEKEFIHRDGRRIPIMVGGGMIGEARDQGVAFAIDLSELKTTQEALRQSEERLRMAKTAANLGIHDYDVATGSIGWDERVRELWGVERDTLITYEVFISGLHPDDRAPTQEAVDRVLAPGGDGKFYAEYRVRALNNGVERWVAATGHVTFAERSAARLVGTVQDITERKRMEESFAGPTPSLSERFRSARRNCE